MNGMAKHRLPAVFAAVTLVLLVAGCSSGESDAGSAPTTVTVTASGSSAPQPRDSDPDPGSAPTDSPVADTEDVATPAPVVRPASDFSDGSRYSFATPSKQTQCRVTTTTLACQTRGRPHTVATDSLCGIYRGDEQSRADLFGYLEGGTLPCATITQGEPYVSPHTLQYRESVTFTLSQGFTVTCTAAPRGLTCIDSDAHNGAGFFLSVDSFTQL